jgi:hypothetical protein
LTLRGAGADGFGTDRTFAFDRRLDAQEWYLYFKPQASFDLDDSLPVRFPHAGAISTQN